MVSNYVPWYIEDGGTQAIEGLPFVGDTEPGFFSINADELGGVKWW